MSLCFLFFSLVTLSSRPRPDCNLYTGRIYDLLVAAAISYNFVMPSCHLASSVNKFWWYLLALTSPKVSRQHDDCPAWWLPQHDDCLSMMTASAWWLPLVVNIELIKELQDDNWWHRNTSSPPLSCKSSTNTFTAPHMMMTLTWYSSARGRIPCHWLVVVELSAAVGVLWYDELTEWWRWGSPRCRHAVGSGDKRGVE